MVVKRYLFRDTLDFIVIMALVMFGLFEFTHNTAEAYYGYVPALMVFLLVILYIFSATVKNFCFIVRDMVLPLFRKSKEADLEKKKKTIEELKKLQGYIRDARLAIDRGFMPNESRHGGISLLKKYERFTGKVDVEKGVTLRVIDDRIDEIIATMEIYSYQEALNELGVKEPEKRWDFAEGNSRIVEVR